MTVVDKEHRRVIAKRDVLGDVVYVLHQTATGRGIRGEDLYSRVVLLHEIHELIVTADPVVPGGRADDVRYVAFFEVSQGGVLRVGDSVWIDSLRLGELACFDLTHMPNHFNLVIRTDAPRSGEELGLALGARVRFTSWIAGGEPPSSSQGENPLRLPAQAAPPPRLRRS